MSSYIQKYKGQLELKTELNKETEHILELHVTTGFSGPVEKCKLSDAVVMSKRVYMQ